MSTEGPAPDAAQAASNSTDTWWPYALPLGVFLFVTSLEGYLPRAASGGPDSFWYPLAYVVKLAAVIITAWFCRATWRDLRPVPGARALGLAVVVGLLVAVGWVGLERLPYPRIGVGGSRQAFDPGVLAPLGRAGFLAARLLGLVVVVPVIEELFWRSFLNRVIQDPDFWKLPVGQVTVVSAAVTAGLFAAAHPEWLPALLTGLSWAWLLHHTRSLLACVASHAVANAALGGYVLATGSWELW